SSSSLSSSSSLFVFNDNNRSSIINSTAAVLAASTCTTITAPFDAIKTRLQLTNEEGGSMTTVLKKMLREDGGIKNLFRGLSLRLGRKGISAGISWCIYEELIKSNYFQSKFL
ncbi:solute carrier family 25, member 38, partial [Candida albicans P37037]